MLFGKRSQDTRVGRSHERRVREAHAERKDEFFTTFEEGSSLSSVSLRLLTSVQTTMQKIVGLISTYVVCQNIKTTDVSQKHLMSSRKQNCRRSRIVDLGGTKRKKTISEPPGFFRHVIAQGCEFRVILQNSALPFQHLD